MALVSPAVSIFITINYNAAAPLISDTPSPWLVTALGALHLGDAWARGHSHPSHREAATKFCVFQGNLEKARIVLHLEIQYFMLLSL